MNDSSDIQNGHVRLATQEDETPDLEAIAPVDADAEAEAGVSVETDEEVEAETHAPETEASSGIEAEATPRARKANSETLESEAEIAADYLEELLDIADLDGDIDTYIEGDRAHVSIVSGSDVLVGPNGTVLDALQELARLAVMTETGERSRLMLDVAGFREQRKTELISLAAEAVEEVKSSQEKVPLAPMNPFERKIVHDAVAAAGLTSASEGEEPDGTWSSCRLPESSRRRELTHSRPLSIYC